MGGHAIKPFLPQCEALNGRLRRCKKPAWKAGATMCAIHDPGYAEYRIAVVTDPIPVELLPPPPDVPKDVREVLRDLVQGSKRDVLLLAYFACLEDPFASHDEKRKAADSIFDRVYGKPKTTAEIAGEGGGPLTLIQLLANAPGQITDTE